MERERSGITIDFCSSCRGVWLDRGELENLVSREQSYYTERYGDRDDDDDRRRGRRGQRDRDDDNDDDNGGFLGNLLDLFGN
jgi:Zn-finger nucleic acid-binding protein